MDPQSNGGRGPLVHAADPDDVLMTLDRGLLTADERSRTAQLHRPADRDARMAAHLLVRWSAAQLTGQAIETLELVQRCPECGSGDHGRPLMPAVPDLHVSLARTRTAVAAAVGWDPVGVDVETPRSGTAIGPAPLSLALTEAEILRVQSAPDPVMAFLHHWTLKESLVKAGAARLDTLTGIDIELSAAHRTADGRLRTSHGALHLVAWFDPALDAVVAAAGTRTPVVGSFPPGRRKPGL